MDSLRSINDQKENLEKYECTILSYEVNNTMKGMNKVIKQKRKENRVSKRSRNNEQK